MRKTIITGLTTVMAIAAVAGPAYARAPVPSSPSVPSPPPPAQTPAVPANPAVPSSPTPAAVPSQPDAPGTLHIRNFTVRKSHNRGGYVYASASIVGTNLPMQGVKVTYRSSLKTYNPHTLGPWRNTSGSVGIAGGDTILSLKFGYKGKTVAQVRKSLKITIANATNGAVITNGTSVGSGSAPAPAFPGS
jgi:hypothetical protein